jgi:uncharacterized membrane protein YccC
MQVNATRAAVEPPVTFAALAASSWAFAVRVWLAMIVALYASFWLELETPSSAAITVAILALPSRGQGLEKAGFRLIATIIGVAASIAIAGLFAQTDGLMLAVFSAWIGLCVYAAAMLDGNRAYAAALCCITVALIAVQQIDNPQQVFASGVARGAAIAVGVLATALVNDVLAAPDYHPVLLERLEALHGRVMRTIENVVRGETASSAVAAGLLRDIAAVRPEIASLVTESSSGNARSVAARTAMVDLVTGLFLARALAALLAVATPAMREQTASALDGGSGALPLASGSNNPDDGSSDLLTNSLAWLRRELIRKNADIRGSLAALRAGVHPAREWRAPLYRSHRIAAETGVRAGLHFTLAAIFFVVAGWPATDICLSLVAVMIALGSTAPDARLFTTIAILATPIACMLAGILKYLVLDGVSQFQLLAIGLAPFIIGLALLLTLPSRRLSSLGRLILVFTLVVLALSNPQTYDPTTFLVMSLFVCLSAVLSFTAQLLVPPWPNDRRFAQLLKEARRELSDPDAPRHPHLAPEEANFRDAARIEQIVAATGTLPAADRVLDQAMCCFDQAGTLRRCRAELDKLANDPLAKTAQAARTALAQRDASAMLACARALQDAPSRRHDHAASASAALVLAGLVFSPVRSAAGSIENGAP